VETFQRQGNLQCQQTMGYAHTLQTSFHHGKCHPPSLLMGCSQRKTRNQQQHFPLQVYQVWLNQIIVAKVTI
jgi:hypothetical protein